jgi:hypothetical protein
VCVGLGWWWWCLEEKKIVRGPCAPTWTLFGRCRLIACAPRMWLPCLPCLPYLPSVCRFATFAVRGLSCTATPLPHSFVQPSWLPTGLLAPLDVSGPQDSVLDAFQLRRLLWVEAAIYRLVLERCCGACWAPARGCLEGCRA